MFPINQNQEQQQISFPCDLTSINKYQNNYNNNNYNSNIHNTYNNNNFYPHNNHQHNQIIPNNNNYFEYDCFNNLNESLDSWFEEELYESLQNLTDNDFPYNNHNLFLKPKRRLSLEQRERRNKRRRANLFPRILKRDPRRNYAQMFINVFNLADEHMIQRYLDRYYSPNLQMAKNFADQKTPSHRYESRGRFLITNFLNICYSSMPDVTLTLLQSQVRIDPRTNTSVIVMKVRLAGTMVAFRSQEDYDHMMQMNQKANDVSASEITPFDLSQDIVILQDDETNDENKSLDDSMAEFAASSSPSSSSVSSSTASDYDITYEQPIDPLTFNQYHLPTPLSGTFEPHISLYLNANHHIERFEMLMPSTCCFGSQT